MVRNRLKLSLIHQILNRMFAYPKSVLNEQRLAG